MIASNACSGLIPLLPWVLWGVGLTLVGGGRWASRDRVFVIRETWERKPTVDASARSVWGNEVGRTAFAVPQRGTAYQPGVEPRG